MLTTDVPLNSLMSCRILYPKQFLVEYPERTQHAENQPWAAPTGLAHTPPSSDVGCLPSSSPLAHHPHQFTCNRKILVHDDSDDSLLIHDH